MGKLTLPQSGLKHGASRTERELAEAIAEDEWRQGRPHTPRERAAFAAGYRAEARQLASWTVR